MGQPVRTLVQTAEPAGYHQVEWNGLDDKRMPVAAGLYIYRLEAGEFVQARKLLLIK